MQNQTEHDVTLHRLTSKDTQLRNKDHVIRKLKWLPLSGQILMSAESRTHAQSC